MQRNQMIGHSQVYFVISLSTLYLALLLPGCAEEDLAAEDISDDEQTWDCEKVPLEDVSSDTISRYDIEPEQIVDIAFGTWKGTYPGGENFPEFSFKVTVNPLGSDSGPVAPSLDSLWGVAAPAEVDDKVPLSAHEQCAGLYVAAEVIVGVDDPALSFAEEKIGLRGFELDRAPDPTVFFEFPRGVVYINNEIQRKGEESTLLSFLFLADGTLWISAEEDGYLYLKSGHKLH